MSLPDVWRTSMRKWMNPTVIMTNGRRLEYCLVMNSHVPQGKKAASRVIFLPLGAFWSWDLLIQQVYSEGNGIVNTWYLHLGGYQQNGIPAPKPVAKESKGGKSIVVKECQRPWIVESRNQTVKFYQSLHGHDDVIFKHVLLFGEQGNGTRLAPCSTSDLFYMIKEMFVSIQSMPDY